MIVYLPNLKIGILVGMDKVIFNITFHWQLDQLKWHLENIFSWESSDNHEYLIVSAHKDNLSKINDWVDQNYSEKKVETLFIDGDYKNHLGCTVNVIEGLKHIRDNKEYDYIVNVEADNMFRDEKKFLKLVGKLKENNKHMLLVDHDSVYGKLFNKHPQQQSRNYFHMTTLNIYSKYYVDNHLFLDYDEEFMDYGWYGAPGTPFESYFALVLLKKNSINNDKELLDYLEKYTYRLSYSRNANPCNFAEPDDLTPDRYMKYGIMNCPNARDGHGASQPDIWRSALRFVQLHDPLKYDF